MTDDLHLIDELKLTYSLFFRVAIVYSLHQKLLLVVVVVVVVLFVCLCDCVGDRVFF